VAIKSDHGSNTLSINGLPVFSDVRQPELTGGQVGLVTHSVVGQFDKMLTTTPIGDQPFKDDFTSDAPGWTSQSGQWNVANGTYNNGAVQQTSITLAPIHTDHQVQSDRTSSFTVRARMVNPYANAGNLVGLVFNYGAASYSEVVFSPTGVAKMNRVTNGTVQTLATATYNGRRNVWFDVTLDSTPSVWVDGEKIFDHVTAANPDSAPAGDVGLITHWAPGRFDDVWFDHGVFRSSCSESFASGPVPETVSGTWTVNAGTLNATSVNAGSIALPCASRSASGLLCRAIATTELVVPRSMPTARVSSDACGRGVCPGSWISSRLIVAQLRDWSGERVPRQRISRDSAGAGPPF